MRLLLLTLTLTLSLTTLAAEPAAAADAFDPQKLQILRTYLQEHGSSSMLIVHKGEVAFSYGDVHKPHLIHSVRKALLNSLYGMYVAKGVIDLDKTLAELNIDDVHGLSETEKSATLRQLLQSRSGVYHPATAESAWMKQQKPPRGSHKPGEFHYYNNWDFNAAGAIFTRLTGKGVLEAFFSEIAEPIGMQDLSGKLSRTQVGVNDDEIPQVDGFYQFEPAKSQFPAYHMRLSAADLARYGQLYLQNGQWNGQQLVPAEWIRQSTQMISETNPRFNLGYGMLWAVVQAREAGKRNSFYHTGVGVHFLAVYPEDDMVVVHRVNTEQDYSFTPNDLYPIIGMVFAAKN
ncbi:serine hydrolase [Bowmanella sp. JS7-9]|uniref:serine hydrolase domain-containing protein n=1 Tax=Alteromonadaceae TaxID=72275 RepID=UPI00103C1568|nr:serine hydrolase [Bowmanella sp. JS7-9]TBX22940.1 hypothetical protein TK45_08275 [Bowmanella sp. JS7-9]